MAIPKVPRWQSGPKTAIGSIIGRQNTPDQASGEGLEWVPFCTAATAKRFNAQDARSGNVTGRLVPTMEPIRQGGGEGLGAVSAEVWCGVVSIRDLPLMLKSEGRFRGAQQKPTQIPNELLKMGKRCYN